MPFGIAIEHTFGLPTIDHADPIRLIESNLIESNPITHVDFFQATKLRESDNPTVVAGEVHRLDGMLNAARYAGADLVLIDTAPRMEAAAIDAAKRGDVIIITSRPTIPDIGDAYFDGILWAEIGEKPENLLSIISDLITRLTGTPPGLATIGAAASALGEALGERRILLIIDDAWREQDLRPFLEGGRNTTRLITTRLDDILPAKAERQKVDAMSADEALSLLSWELPKDQTAAQTQALSALAQRLGEWALLLKLVNGFLRERVVKSHEALPQAITGVSRRLDLKGFTAFDAKNAVSRANAIAKTIGVSIDLLDENERARFSELAIFPEDVDVPLTVVSRLWRQTGGMDEFDTEDLLQRLQNLSLVRSLDLDRRTFRFHDTVRHFLQEQAGKDALATLHKRLAKALDGIGVDKEADDASRRYYFLHQPAHLEAAGDRPALDALLQDPAWLKAKLELTGSPQDLVADYDQFAQGEMQELIGRTLRLTSGICARDKRQLIPQLHGRLVSRSAAALFCTEALKSVAAPAILNCCPSLTPPGAELARLEGHAGSVRALAVLPNGRLASGSYDNSIMLWGHENRPGVRPARRAQGLGHGARGLARRPPRLRLRQNHKPLGRENRPEDGKARGSRALGRGARGLTRRSPRLGILGQDHPALGREDKPGDGTPRRL